MPEAAVEAGIGAQLFYWPSLSEETLRRDSEAVLTAALETGTLIAAPRDEQGRRELVEKVARKLAADDGNEEMAFGLSEVSESAARFRRVYEEKAIAVLQALGLLPEQEEAKP